MSRWTPYAMLGLWLLLGVVSVLLPDVSGIDLGRALLPPGADAPLGTDPLGRPLGRLLLGGAETALIIGVTSVLIAGTAGAIVGTAAGYFGGWVDAVVMRVVDVLLAFPGILLAIAITAVFGPSTTNIVLALAVLGWTGFARLTRGQTLVLRGEPYVLAARTLGLPPHRIFIRHLIPNLLAPVLVQASFGMAGAILAESSLSFLGLGDPTRPSWGGLLSEGVRYLRMAPHLSILPGVAIFLVVLALNLVGDDLADRLNPGAGKG